MVKAKCGCDREYRNGYCSLGLCSESQWQVLVIVLGDIRYRTSVDITEGITRFSLNDV